MTKLNISYVIEQLHARLPELEWSLSQCSPVMNGSSLPPGLFRSQETLTPLTSQMCVNEIREDLYQLNQTSSERAAQFLAKQITQKIDVLVHVCTRQAKSPTKQVRFGVTALSTRQQWLHELQAGIDQLKTQEHALSSSLTRLYTDSSQVRLNLEVQWGEIKRQLTLAQEAYARAMVLG